MRISWHISRVTPLVWLIWLISLNACGGKLPASVVIPDSHTLHPGVSCTWDGDPMKGGTATNCQYDPYRVNIDLGYLRGIMEELDACRKREF